LLSTEPLCAEQVTSLTAGRRGPDCFQIWCGKLRGVIQFNLHALLRRLEFHEGRPYDWNTVLTQNSMNRFYAKISRCFPHELDLVDNQDHYWPSEDEEKMDQATRDDMYAFMLLVNRRTLELTDSATS
jgi:hypothetical protein